MKIHPKALIQPGARLADDVEVGPYACIGSAVTVGPRCIIQAHAILTGEVVMGSNNVVGYGAVIGGEPQDHAYTPSIRSRVVIGDNNYFREYCTVHRGTSDGSATRVGNNNYFMAGSHLAHNTSVGNHVTIANNVLLAGHVEVQDHAYLGGGDVFHQFVRVGWCAHTQGNGGFSKDVPPFTTAAILNVVTGINSAGLRRAGFPPDLRAEIKRAFRLVYRCGLNITQALEHAAGEQWSPEVMAFFKFVSTAKKRGVCDIRKKLNGVALPARVQAAPRISRWRGRFCASSCRVPWFARRVPWPASALL
jgi:UDP-N-acetylglucosamine acyltransferase